MFITAGGPTRSIRAHAEAGQELLLVGGEGHHTGSGEARPERYGELIQFARRHWELRAIGYRWSTQDYVSADGLPYIGRLHPLSGRLYVATGFGKWGMTGGTVAGMLISDAILGCDNAFADAFSSTRVRPRPAVLRLLTENAKIGLRFFGDRLRHRATRKIADLRPGEGAIVSAGGGKVAGYRDLEGRLHAVSTTCTHLGCQVVWNAAEASWDCPCHGSRFTVEGDILSGPAVEPLPPRSTV
jgi:nitrite reductase/ring-hydroxylating ferredoxin subunit